MCPAAHLADNCLPVHLQALRAAHNRSLEVLAEAEARLQDEQAAKAGRVAKAQQEAEEKAAAAALGAKQLAAAIQIQAAWRGFKVGPGGGCTLHSSSQTRPVSGTLSLVRAVMRVIMRAVPQYGFHRHV